MNRNSGAGIGFGMFSADDSPDVCSSWQTSLAFSSCPDLNNSVSVKLVPSHGFKTLLMSATPRRTPPWFGLCSGNQENYAGLHMMLALFIIVGEPKSQKLNKMG